MYCMWCQKASLSPRASSVALLAQFGNGVGNYRESMAAPVFINKSLKFYNCKKKSLKIIVTKLLGNGKWNHIVEV